MNQRPDKTLFEECALVKGIAESFVEKDWFVTQIIASLSQIRLDGFELVFTGGTALSKAHNLIKRFSEDVDFRVIVSSEHQTRKALSKFKNSVLEKLKTDGIPIDDAHVRARDENRFFSIDVDYPSYFSLDTALRPHIQIEITARDIQLLPVHLSVSSFVNELTKKTPEVKDISCIDPVESAADKLSALTWRISDRVRGDKYDDPSLVRHLHDLAILKDIALANPSFSKLVFNSMASDDRRPKTNQVFSGLPIKEKFDLLLNALGKDKEYTREYDLFVKGVSYASENDTPNFETTCRAIQKLIDAVTNSTFVS
ncbi:MAG: nucleotidyl transferase AbiEii/AbiGii toxin family protein [Alphaproteobacteria bacterium]|nr:nucleotidyl transferase AbiEii/AbiGii toxin family protein [Alphaproteobacteria bacterium]